VVCAPASVVRAAGWEAPLHRGDRGCGPGDVALHYEARLEKNDPQDEGEDTLVLDLVIEPSNGTDNPVREEVPYEEQTEVRYSGPAEAWYEDIVVVSRNRFPVDRVW
jgi:hypothetical protein